ncbi:sugar-binding protein [uncultured Pseudomonas sp.]|uniref:RHS repeat domain-containing protein n=1 Tax=uncultured Pseudomonas sp. TaxID=114707 RepID=UPI002589C8AD|nr:sugar-binding protein [uncultured Pseudomonas sp.]
MSTQKWLHSNAFNFMSFVQNSVDPRTGQYTLGIALPELVGNQLMGPSLSLRLVFNPLSSQDAGFGHGWGLNLTQYTPATNMLELHTGERYKITGSDTGDGTGLGIDERKLESFHIHEDTPGTHWRVVHSSGLVEFLQLKGSSDNTVALPVRIEGPLGHGITLAYNHSFNGVPCLTSVEDDAGLKLLALLYSSSDIHLDLHPEAGRLGEPLARYTLGLSSQGTPALRLPVSVVLPFDQDDPSANKGSWRLQYQHIAYERDRNLAVLRKVDNPAGGSETIEYEHGEKFGHRFPGDVHPALPRVKRHLFEPGAGQPAMLTTYAYSDNNFLGRGAAGVSWVDNGLDNLYKFTGSEFEYYTQATHYLHADLPENAPEQVVKTVTQYYNRFHLMTRQVNAQNKHVHEVATKYHETPGLPFSQQVKFFQMPDTVTRRWRVGSGETWPREETDKTLYDDYGNLLDETLANGVRTRYSFYPKEGAGTDCPPDPQSFVRSLRDTTVIPGAGDQGQPVAPMRCTRLTYQHLPAKAGAHDTAGALVVKNETLLKLASESDPVGQPYSATQYTYYRAQQDVMEYGRLQSQVTTLDNKSTQVSYVYEMSDGIGANVLQTVQTHTGFDHGTAQEYGNPHHALKVITLLQDVLINQPLLNRDDNEVEIAYRYDALRRVVEEIVSPNDTEFRASRLYTYSLVTLAGQQAEQTSEDVKGVVTRTWVDGLNRAVAQERQDADNSDLLRAEAMRASYKMTHDGFGNLVEETEYDWLDYEPDKVDARAIQQAGKPVSATAAETAYTTRYLFDDWGQQYCQIGPDKVRHFEQTDPQGNEQWRDGPVQTSWRESEDGELRDASTGELLEPGAMGRTGKTVSWLNLFEKPVQVERFTLDQPGQSASSYSVQQNRYDGLGRLTQEIDPRKASTHFAYDLFDRKVDETLADGSVVHRDYASHSGEDLPVLIQVGDKVLGEQVFDGLDRMVVSITGGRKRQMFYQPGQRQPETVITPAGQTIHYQYNPKLNAEPVTRKVVDTGPQGAAQSFEASYEYDPKNARLSTAVEGGELLERTYFSTGTIRTEVRNDHVMHYQTSLRERALTYTDVLGQVQRYVYNAAGQLELTTLGELTAHFTYDTLGRQFKIDTRDAEQFLTTELRYDAFDREVSRTFTMSDTGQSLTQEYDVRDALTSRTLHEGEHLLRKETYDYDDRGRLEAYTSDGELSPVDPFGKVIREQYFRFDDIDNITRVLTVFPGGSNTARYAFDNAQDPAQLTGIENDHPDYLEGNVALVYDANGCLIKDEAGRALKYDGLNRLINVTVPASDDLPEQTSRYGYDPVDRLASQEK